jgi:hypothetical protein
MNVWVGALVVRGSLGKLGCGELSCIGGLRTGCEDVSC